MQGQGFPDNELEGPESMKKVVARCGPGPVVCAFLLLLVPASLELGCKKVLGSPGAAPGSGQLGQAAAVCAQAQLPQACYHACVLLGGRLPLVTLYRSPACSAPRSSLYEHSNQYPQMMGVPELRQVSSRAPCWLPGRQPASYPLQPACHLQLSTCWHNHYT